VPFDVAQGMVSGVELWKKVFWGGDFSGSIYAKGEQHGKW
jgi:hypothetical protein